MSVRLPIKFLFLTAMLASAGWAQAEFQLIFKQGFDDNTAVIPVGGNQGLTVGEQRQKVIERAALIWEYYLEIPVDIKMEVSFSSLACDSQSGVLGAAGPEWADRSFTGAPLNDVWYSGALALQLRGFKLPGDPDVDITAAFNSALNGSSNCLAGTSWYYGFDNQPGPRQLSLLNTVLHEVAHGLGFISLVGEDSQGVVNGQFPQGFIDVFSRQLYDQALDQSWNDMSPSEVRQSATNDGSLGDGALVWNGALTGQFSTLLDQGVSQGRVKMYSPFPWESGSSVSHFDKSVSYRFQFGQEELMEPRETSTSISDFLTLSLLADIGWQLKTDFDGDGLLDEADSQPIIANNNDSDGDGQSNDVDIDDDNDGMSDQFERQNFFDPYDPTDAALDTDGDGLSNLEEFVVGSDPRLLDQPPRFSGLQPVIRIDSTGAFTNYEFPGVVAQDASGDLLSWNTFPLPPWRAGTHDLSLIAVDKFGIQTTESVQLQIRPLLALSGFSSAVEGDDTAVDILLNGPAISGFPIAVDYAIGGSAIATQDHSLSSGMFIINSQAGETFSYQVFNDALSETAESLLIDLLANDEFATNEFSQLDVQLLDDGDVLQQITLQLASGGQAVSRISQGGFLDVTALVNDTRAGSYSFDWSGSDDMLGIDTETGSAFTVDTSMLSLGLYRLEVLVTDVSNISNMSQSSIAFVVDAGHGPDTDQDGVEDSFDGPAYAYLLQSAPSNKNSFLLEAEPQRWLRLGDTALTANTQGAFLSAEFFSTDTGFEYTEGIYDFEIRNLRPGASAKLLIPLTAEIQSGEALRVFMPSGLVSGQVVQGSWREFSLDAFNRMSSGLGSYRGFCPAFSDPDFVEGLNAGDDCLQLQIQDGGPNDTDGKVNGIVSAIVGVSSVQPRRSGGGGGGSLSWAMLLLMYMFLLRIVTNEQKTDVMRYINKKS